MSQPYESLEGGQSIPGKGKNRDIVKEIKINLGMLEELK